MIGLVIRQSGCPQDGNVAFLERGVAVLETHDYPPGRELVCDTAEEFAAKRDAYGIARVALEEGISVS